MVQGVLLDLIYCCSTVFVLFRTMIQRTEEHG